MPQQLGLFVFNSIYELNNASKTLKWKSYSAKLVCQLTYISIENCDSFAANLFVCTNMLVDAPVAPPATANTSLASVQTKSTNKIQQNIKFRAKLFQIINHSKGQWCLQETNSWKNATTARKQCSV